MDEEDERKVEYLHMTLGFLAGVASGLASESGTLLGIAIAYLGFLLSKSVFKLDDLTFNQWISKGAFPFLMFWLPMWIFIYNL